MLQTLNLTEVILQKQYFEFHLYIKYLKNPEKNLIQNTFLILDQVKIDWSN